MKLIIFYTILLMIGIIVVYGGYEWINGAPCPIDDNYSKMSVGQLLTQITLSVLTFATLFFYMFGKRIINWLHGPSLTLIARKDGVHSVLATNHSGIGDSDVLRLYVHVENDSQMPATGCQLIANIVYVSVDGLHYDCYQRWQTAKFQWVYSSRDNKFEVDIRKSLERYARILEIVQQDQSDDSGDDSDSGYESDSAYGASTIEASWFVIQLPQIESCDTRKRISIPPQYRHIVLPITCVSREGKAFTSYIHVGWHGVSVSQFQQPGLLKIEVLTKRQAEKLITK